MPSGVRLGLVVWLMMLIVSACDFPRTSPTVNDNPASTILEARWFAEPTDKIHTAVSIYVEHGDVSILAVESADANHILVIAPTIAVNDALKPHLIVDEVSGRELITVTHVNTSNPFVPTHVYVQPNVPIDIRADHGDIHIAGSVGRVIAEAKNGSIDVRGPVPGLDLKVGGAGHGIVVDGVHKQLNLYAQAGPIEITAEDVTVNASTGGDGTFQNSPILFVGSLTSGTNGAFTTTSASDITLVLPRNESYDLTAQTTGQSIIDVQYPGPAGAAGIPACGTFDPGEPYIARVDDSDHPERAEIIFNQGGQPFTGTLSLRGRLTADSFAFHSSVRTFYALLPEVEQLFIDTCGSAPVAPPAQGQTASATGTLTPEQQALVDSFTGGAPANAQGVQVSAAPSVPASPSTCLIMQPTRCPFKWQEKKRDHVLAVTSNGGRIRIYQNLP